MFIRWKLTGRLNGPPSLVAQVCRSERTEAGVRLVVVKHLCSIRQFEPGKIYSFVAKRFWEKCRVRLAEIPNLSQADREKLEAGLSRVVPKI